MAEKITLNTLIVKPSVSDVSPKGAHFDFESDTVTFEYRFSDGTLGSSTWVTPSPDGSSRVSGRALIRNINRADFSGANDSLQKKLMKRALTDGDIPAGAVSGTPD